MKTAFLLLFFAVCSYQTGVDAFGMFQPFWGHGSNRGFFDSPFGPRPRSGRSRQASNPFRSPIRGLPQRTDKNYFDETRNQIVVEIHAPEATQSSFNLELDGETRTLKISEKCQSRSNFRCDNAFSKKWQIPRSVDVDGSTAEWNDAADTLIVRLPTQIEVRQNNQAAVVDNSRHQNNDAAFAGSSRRPSSQALRSRAASTTRQDTPAQSQSHKTPRRHIANDLPKHNEHRPQNKPPAAIDRTPPACSRDMAVQVLYPPDGRYYNAQLGTLDFQSGRFALTWADGSSDFTVLPMRQKYVRGCRFVETDTSIHSDNSDADHPQSRAAKDSRSPVHSSKPSETYDDDGFFEIEDIAEDAEAMAKDEDASSGYYLFGEFHEY